VAARSGSYAAVTREVSLIEFPNGSSQCLVEGESQ